MPLARCIAGSAAVACPAVACHPPLHPPPHSQLVDKQQDLVRVQRLASFNSINIQASAGSSGPHVLSEEESPMAGSPAGVADITPLKGGDGYDRLLEYRCGRYLFHHGEATFLPVPALPADFGPALAAVAASRNIKGARPGAEKCGSAGHRLPAQLQLRCWPCCWRTHAARLPRATAPCRPADGRL